MRKLKTAASVATAGNATGKKKKVWLYIVIVVAVAALAAFLFLRGRQSPAAMADGGSYTVEEVVRGDITSEITGSGTLEAADSYIVTSLAQGDILTANFEEGDHVEKDDILYTLDSSDVSSSLEQAQISLNQQKRNYDNKLENADKLKVKAKAEGRVTSLDAEIGDEIKPGEVIATVQDTDRMSLEVPFPADDAMGFAVGQSATVTLDSTFETLPGTVKKVAGIDTVLTGNRIVRNVTIEVKNPGGLTNAQTATAAVGLSESTGGGVFTYGDETVVTAEVAGTVSRLPVKEGDRVGRDDIVAVLTSDTMDDEIQSAREGLRNAEISYDNKSDQLDKYTIQSPISGTVVDKYYKAGETLEAGKTLCTIYDLSYLTMTLDVDELDVSNIKVDQRVRITADAVEGREYEGIVTKVGVIGTSNNGVATYPVTIRMDDCDGLLPGMTVDATITLENAANVLTIPAAALQRGNTVLVTADSPSAASGEPFTQNSKKNGEATAGQNVQYYTVAVTTGISDDDRMEVKSGLQEGDKVAYIARTGSNLMNMFTMGMSAHGGGMGGNRPTGNSGNGRPAGNDRGTR